MQVADLAEALFEGGWNFPIQDLKNSFYIFPGSISTQITGKQAEEVCERTHTCMLNVIKRLVAERVTDAQ